MRHGRDTDIDRVKFFPVQHFRQAGIPARPRVTDCHRFRLRLAGPQYGGDPDPVHPGQDVSMHFAEPACPNDSDI
ncbi:hypothetical protein D1872_310370 [compost metagenome]